MGGGRAKRTQPMNPYTGGVLYVLIWWTVLFAVLPFGTHPEDVDQSAGGWRGAPTRPHIGRKVLATTAIATVIWVVAYIVITGPWLSFRSGWLAMPNP